MPKEMISLDIRVERGFLMGVELKRKRSEWSIEDSLAELAQLARTAGIEVVGQAYQRLDRIHPATYIGSGKVEELVMLQRELDYDVLLFDQDLSPRQQRELERALGQDVKVLDRTALILDIFAQHAHTREGALQVELAQYEYRLPRLTRAWTHLARQAGGRAGGSTGGVGLRGPGETQLEMDRQHIEDRIAQLKRELEAVHRHRELYRARRRRTPIPIVSIIGYTNAGKSTLLNAVSGSEVLVEDKLFATLDPTTRRVTLPEGMEALFTDTVGFIQKLPTQLVAAFHATLEEINEADLLLHIVDVTHPKAQAQCRAVEETLEEIGSDHIPVINALNKIDRFDDSEAAQSAVRAFPNSIAISARYGLGLRPLLERIEEILNRRWVPIAVHIPFSAGESVALFHRRGRVETESYDPTGTIISGWLPLQLVGRFQSYVVEEDKPSAPVGR
ncbi:MAG: GTPase HflX [Chloroflexota bacterium]|nr:GTPase HflX [Chloroflexota bacterium]